MKLYLIAFAISIVAAIFVMIIHEFTKALVYFVYLKKNCEETNKVEMFKLWRYIDPIGLVLGVTNYGIFSRQYPFLIKSKKAAILIGVSGFLVLLVLAFCSSAVFRLTFSELVISGEYLDLSSKSYVFAYFLEFITYYSVVLFWVNIFPIASFDISLIFAGTLPTVFSKIRKYDAIFKLIFMILIILEVFSNIGVFISSIMLV